MSKQRIQHFIRIAIFLVFMFILWRMVDWTLLPILLQQVRFEWILVASLLYFGNIAIRVYRWKSIFTTDFYAMSFKDAYLMTLIGITLNILIPATLGDIARFYYGYKLYGVKEHMLSSVLVDKLFAFCALFLLGGVSGIVMGEFQVAAVALGMSLLVCLPLIHPTLVPWKFLNKILGLVKKSLDVDKLVNTFHLPFKKKLWMLIVSLGGWLGNCVFFYVLCLAFPVNVGLGYIIMIIPLITIVRLFPFTVNALGPAEIAFSYFLGAVGVHSTLAILISLTSNILSSIIPGLLGGILIIFMGQRLKGSAARQEQKE